MTVHWTRAIQVLEVARDMAEARMMAASLRAQEGCIGVRILPATPATPTIRVQALFTDDGPAGDGWLPDGCRRVMIPARVLATIGSEVTP